MNVTQFCLDNRTTTLVLTAFLVVGGVQSYRTMGRLEDPDFTIKDAVIATPYPGATAVEVEEEVTDKIEVAVQKLKQLDEVESMSLRGLSIVTATIKDSYDKTTLPQVWDELRRKVGDAQSGLPPGAGPSIVNDDFGDVYGVFFALYGEGYSQAELYEVAKLLRRELLLVQDVAKIDFFGVEPEVIYVEPDRDRMSQLGIQPGVIIQELKARNVAAYSGHVKVGPEWIVIEPTGVFVSVADLGSLLLSGEPGGAQIFLRDVATIRRGYQDPPNTILRFNGQPSIGLGVSTVPGGNVVTMGEGLKVRLQELKPQIPLGIEFGVVAMQSDAVTTAINSFLVSLLEAVAIVVVVLLLFMGLRSGLLIGFIRQLHHHATHGGGAGADLSRRPDHRPRHAGGQRHRCGGRDARENAAGNGSCAGRTRDREADRRASAWRHGDRRAGFRGHRHLPGLDGRVHPLAVHGHSHFADAELGHRDHRDAVARCHVPAGQAAEAGRS
jgi:multidrug efflux pump subunit AcrB